MIEFLYVLILILNRGISLRFVISFAFSKIARLTAAPFLIPAKIIMAVGAVKAVRS